MFSFFRKSRVELGAQKALKEAGVHSKDFGDYLRFIKGLGFIEALDASRDALPQSIQSLCLAFASLELMILRCRLHGQSSYVAAINESQEYLSQAIQLQISLAKNPEHTERNANILLENIMKDAREFIKETAMRESL